MTIAEILEHPWLQEDTATEDEVYEEMRHRRMIIKQTTPDAERPFNDPNIFKKIQKEQEHWGFDDKGVEAALLDLDSLKVKPY